MLLTSPIFLKPFFSVRKKQVQKDISLAAGATSYKYQQEEAEAAQEFANRCLSKLTPPVSYKANSTATVDAQYVPAAQHWDSASLLLALSRITDFVSTEDSTLLSSSRSALIRADILTRRLI